jgi:hypothetical protein
VASFSRRSFGQAIAELVTSTMRPADHIFIWCTGYTHHGIYAGDGKVFHYASRKGTNSTPCIAKESLETFKGEAETHIQPYQPDERLPPREVLARAASCLGEQNYSLFANNCEHFAVWCKTGSLASRQSDFAQTLLERTPDLLNGPPADVLLILVSVASIWKDLHECQAVCRKHGNYRRLLRRETRTLRRREHEETSRLCRDLLQARAELKLALRYDIARLKASLAADRERRDRFLADRSRKATAIKKLFGHLEAFHTRAVRSGSDEDFEDYRFLLARLTEMLTLY